MVLSRALAASLSKFAFFQAARMSTQALVATAAATKGTPLTRTFSTR